MQIAAGGLKQSHKAIRVAWIRRISLSIGILSALAPAFAQAPITFQYVYDDLNQLVRVIDSTGVTIQYTYDAAGNITQVNRSTIAPGALTIFSIAPQAAPTGSTITIVGQGFSSSPALNLVTIGGVAATVISATPTTLVVMVPSNAVSGPVVVTVGGISASSPSNETILPVPIILSISPKSALAGTTIPSFTVTGANLQGAIFGFGVGALAVSNVSIASNGTSATFRLAIASSANGRFTLIATSPSGPSDPTLKLGFLPGTAAFNTLTVPGANPNADPDGDSLTNSQEITLGTDPLNADTDGDTYLDGLEVVLGSDPLNPKNVPNLNPPGIQVGPFILLNTVSPASTQPTTHVTTSGFISVLNGISPAPNIPILMEQDGLVFSALNGTSTSSTSLGGPNGVLIDGVPARRNHFFVMAALARAAVRAANGTPVCVDSDHDGLCDEDERLLGTDAFNMDSDGDGYPDGLELALGSDPLDSKSIPNTNPHGFVITPSITLRNADSMAERPQIDLYVRQADARFTDSEPTNHDAGRRSRNAMRSLGSWLFKRSR